MRITYQNFPLVQELMVNTFREYGERICKDPCDPMAPILYKQYLKLHDEVTHWFDCFMKGVNPYGKDVRNR